MPDLKTQLGDYLNHVIERVDIEDFLERRPGVAPLQPIQPRRPLDGPLRWAYAAAAAVVVLLLVGGVAWLWRSSRPEPAGPATTTSAAPTTTSATQGPTSTTVGALPLRQVDLEINITVFFDPEVVEGLAQAEAALRTIVGDADVESITIMERTEAWAESQALAALAPAPTALDSTLQASLGEVARIVVLDREVRNRLTDAIEDSPVVLGVVYVAGTRQGSSRPTLVTQPILWEILGYYWQPTA